MSPNYKRIAIIPDTYEEGPITANDLLDLLPFQQFIINDDEELVSSVPVSEFDLSHLEPDKRRIVIQQLHEFEQKNRQQRRRSGSSNRCKTFHKYRR